MKAFVEKLPLSVNSSFVSRTYTTPYFEVPWHQHVELELILFKKGNGTAFIGNHIGAFTEGDVFFLGSNLPHCFQKADKEMMTSALVIHFTEQLWGQKFLSLPENEALIHLFKRAKGGMKLSNSTKVETAQLMKELENASGFSRLLFLQNCFLQLMKDSSEPLSTQEVRRTAGKEQDRIELVYQYTLDHFQDSITLSDVADKAGMTVPAFCQYFKRSTKKTYIAFLNELRIEQACKLLTGTRKTVAEICYESGYNTLAHFNKQFLRLREQTPLQFRKKCAEQSNPTFSIKHD